MTRKLPIGPMARNLFATAGVQIVVALLSLISGPLQARGLGPEGRGQLAVVLVIGQIAAFLSDAGTLGYVIRERARGRPRGVLIGSVLPILAVSFALWAIAAWPLALVFGKGDPTLTIMILAQLTLLPFTAATQLGSGVALAEERWRIMMIIRLTVAVVPVLGLLVLFLSDRMSVQSACICYFVATIIAAIPALALCLRSRPLVFSWSITLDAWRFGRVSMLTILITMGNTRADVLIVSQFLSLRDAGLYAVASILASMPLMLTSAVAQSLSRRLSLSSLGAETARASRLLLLVMAVICIGVAGAAPFVLPWLFGSAFRESVPILWILLFGTLCASPSNFLGYATSLAGHPKSAAFAQLIGVVVMAVTMIFLVPAWGLIGAAIGSALSYAASAGVLLRNAHGTSGIQWCSYIIPTARDVRDVVLLIRRKLSIVFGRPL
ncbi:oligosaccharide flippase family protein [Xanthobacter dioxanivorans]|uniref:Oligosaccharide flippase family protein n=1 Tax=Xanthobacter dioxanivorans TaxID=2528964 RepID=A0A974PLW8_9HYPH|nr:oligosaccharide flippase family protein [Xanthobacter dioxanivorans]QRG05969.1 oligosaccharide flippase family protein [Xanthobacter dioxanivorans]